MMIGGELYNSIGKTKLGLSVKADRISSVSIFHVNISIYCYSKKMALVLLTFISLFYSCAKNLPVFNHSMIEGYF